MPAQKPSPTALGTARLRAAHQLLDAPPRILEDPLAVTLLGPAAARQIRKASDRYQTPERRALRAHVVLRSRFSEDRLAAAVRRGATQYIILGAGYDTFALRQPDWARSLRILEVDQAETQAAKRECMDAAYLALPENAGFAAVDFECESLRDALLRYSISFKKQTFFSWLGVVMYLNENAVDTVLHTAAAFPAGSEIVLTFAQPPGGTHLAIDRRAASQGEPWLSYFEPAALESKLRNAGFSLVEFLSPEEAEVRYFPQRPQDLPAPKRTGIVSAIR